MRILERKVHGTPQRGAQDKVDAITSNGIADVPCVAHLVQLSLKAGLQVLPVREFTEKCRKIVGLFMRMDKAKRELRKAQRANGDLLNVVILDQDTRWHSTSTMLDRFVKLWPNLNAACKSLRVDRRNSETLNEELDIAIELLDDRETQNAVTRFAKLLAEIRVITRSLETTKRSAVSDILLVNWRLFLGPLYPIPEKGDGIFSLMFKETAMEDLKNRFAQVDGDTLWMCCFLDPRIHRPLDSMNLDNEQALVEYMLGDNLLPKLTRIVAKFGLDGGHLSWK